MAWDSDIGDEPPGGLRDEAPDVLAPIDPDSPIGGHRTPPSGGPSILDSPEQDWTAASALVVPLLRPPGTHGTPLVDIHREELETEGRRAHALPVIDAGPEDLVIAYAIPAGGFDVLVNADHLIAWHIDGAELRATALANLQAWSRSAPWTDEVDGTRRLVSSESGDGSDAARILLPEVRSELANMLGTDARVIVAIPERHLLVAGALRAEDPEFAQLFADFVAAHADGSDEPIDERTFELIDGELRAFVA
jgi:hypothetical protein